MSIMFAPMILPTERELCFLAIAVTVVTSSGKEVPMATMVSETMRSGTPRMSDAMIVPLSTKRREPITMPAAPTTKSRIFLMILLRSVGAFSTVPEPSSLRASETFSKIKTMNSTIIAAAPMTVSSPLSDSAHRRTIEPMKITDLGRYLRRSITAGINKMEIMRIMPVLAVTEPIALPTAISTAPLAAAASPDAR